MTTETSLHIEPIVLRTPTATLTLAIDEQGVGDWWQVHLFATGVDEPLGAECLSYIVTHLTSFLLDAAPGKRWILSLSERHVSVYGEHTDEGVVLHLQDADGRLVAEIALTALERDAWLRTLGA